MKAYDAFSRVVRESSDTEARHCAAAPSECMWGLNYNRSLERMADGDD